MSAALSRWLGAATACIVVAFAIVNGISALRLRRVDASARELSDAIAPRIECLTKTRGVLHELGHALEAGARRHVDQAGLAEMLSETRACAPMRGALRQLFAATAPELDAKSRRAAIDRADLAIESDMQTLAIRSRELGSTIATRRREAADISIGVQSLAALMAIGAIAMAWLAGRQQDRLARERALIHEREHQATVSRAVELEMFASRAAHDLTAPLSAILLYVKSNGEQPFRPEATKLLEQTIAGAIETVDAVLDYARSGGSPDRRGADVGELVTHIMRSAVRQWVEAAGHKVHVDVSVEPALIAGCGRGALASIITNLLRNAFEHAVPRGARRITLRGRRDAERVRIEVSDDGPGVAGDIRPHIFDAYARGESQPRRGLGLGLATVKRFAEGCGGAVGLADTQHGASFWVELPRAPDDARSDDA